MSVTLYLDNKKHLSSSEAARITGYTNDHVARLARQGKVEARRVGKVWYIEETSIFDFLEAQQKEQESRRHQISKERKTEYQTGRIQSRKPKEPTRTKEVFRTFYERTDGALPADLHKRIAALITAVTLVVGTFTFSQTSFAKESFRQLGTAATNTFAAVQNVDPYEIQQALQHAVRENVVADVATSLTHGLGVTILTAYDLTNETYRDDAFTRIDEFQKASAHFVTGIPSRLASLFESEPTSYEQQAANPSVHSAQAANTVTDTFFGWFSGARDFFARLFGTDAQELDLPQTTLSREEYTEVRERLIAEQRAREGLAQEYERPTAEPVQTATTTEPTDSTAGGGTTDGTVTDGTTGTVAQRPVIERTVIEQTAAVTPEVLNLRLGALEQSIRDELEQQTTDNSQRIVNNYTNISRTNKIDRLRDIVIGDSDFEDGGIVSAERGSFSDKLSTGGNLSAGGALSVSGSGTSTIANALTVGGDTLFVNTRLGNVGIGSTSPSTALDVSGSSLVSGDLTVEGTLTSGGNQNLTGDSTANRFLASDRGSDTQPAFSFEDETNTGLFSATTSELAFTTDGTERARFDGSGNFAVGTTTTDSAFELQNATDTQPVARLFSASGAEAFRFTNLGELGIGRTAPAATLDVQNATDTKPVFRFADDTDTELVRLTNSGDLGIGSSTPWAQLSVEYDDAATDNPRFVVGSSTETNLIVDELGNVGLGTTTPSEQLALSNLLYVGGTGTSTIEDSLHVRDSFQVGTSSLFIDNNSITNLTGDLTFQPSGANNVGIGTSSPAQTFSVEGNGYFTEGLGVGVATTTPGVIETSGNAQIGGDLTVEGDTTTLGETDTDTLVVNSTVGSDIIPNQNKTFDLGSSSFFWDTIFADTLNVNTIDAASTTISGTQAEAFTINSDNSTSDTEDMDLIFFRGTVVPNAVIQWDSSNDRFDFNQKMFVQNDSTSTANGASLELLGASDGQQTSDLLRIASSTGEDFVNVTNLGNVGIGTSSPNNLLEVDGGIAIGENYNFTAPTDGAIIEGDVGIGTTSPGRTFSINGTSLFNGLSQFTGGATSSDLTVDDFLFVGGEGVTSLTGGGLTITNTDLAVDETQLNADDFSTDLQEGSVVFSDGSTLTEDNTNFFWNDSADRLGIGTDEPATTSYSTASAGGSVIDLVESANDEIAQLNVRGSGPAGAGMLYVGQGPNFGGGLMFKGDDTPSMPSNQNDISIFRRSSGSDTEVLHWAHDSNTAEFEGDISLNANNIQMDGGWISNDGSNEGIAITDDGSVGVGTSSPGAKFEVQGGDVHVDNTGGGAMAFFDGTSQLSEVGQISTSELTLSNKQSGPITFDTDDTEQVRIDSSGNVGIGDTSPDLGVEITASTTRGYFGVSSADNNDGDIFTIDGSGRVGIGTNVPDVPYSGVDNAVVSDSGNAGFVIESGGTASSFLQFADGQNDALSARIFSRSDLDNLVFQTGAVPTEALRIDSSQRVGIGGSVNDGNRFTVHGTADITGSLGIGTTTPGRKLSVTESVSSAQFSVAYDETRYTNFLTDTSGDLSIDPQGDDVILPDENLQVCSGGACPSGSPSGTGNATIESTLGVGTSTPTEQLAVTNNVYVGGGGSPALGTATSTYEGDIRIDGKLDVGTIDPVYTIDGTKYATYGHSTIGVKEETTKNFTLTKYNKETGYYERRINFDELEKGSDLWLFYQITKFGSFGTWNNLVVTLTPGFDGRTFYEKDPATSTLVIKSTEPGEVSARLVADRFDSSQWPNLRPDQDDDFTNFELESKPR